MNLRENAIRFRLGNKQMFDERLALAGIRMQTLLHEPNHHQYEHSMHIFASMKSAAQDHCLLKIKETMFLQSVIVRRDQHKN